MYNEVYFWLVVIVLSFLAYPYLRFLFKRLQLLRGLKRICRKDGLELTFRKGWLFDGFSEHRTAFTVESSDKIWSVKLVGALKRSNYINLTDRKSYSVRKVYATLRGIHGGVTYDEFISRPKRPFDFTSQIDTSTNKQIVPILLVCPVPTQICGVVGNRLRVIGVGMDTGEGLLYTGSSFIGLLEKSVS